jgi:hypothetical protein
MPRRETHDLARRKMASRGKKKTTFAKLAREGRLRERRLEKQAKKDARKRASDDQVIQLGDRPVGEVR